MIVFPWSCLLMSYGLLWNKKELQICCKSDFNWMIEFMKNLFLNIKEKELGSYVLFVDESTSFEFLSCSIQCDRKV